LTYSKALCATKKGPEKNREDSKKYDNDLISFYDYIDTIFVEKAHQITYYNVWTEVYRQTKVNP